MESAKNNSIASVAAPCVWISRPHCARELSDALRARGIYSAIRPAMKIVDAAPKVTDDFVAAMDDFDWIIFVSGEGARRVCKKMSAPAKVPMLAIGQSTAAAADGFFATPDASPSVGEIGDSETLLQSPILKTPRGLRIAVVGGTTCDLQNTLSPHLCQQLSARGARVKKIAVYRRLPPDQDDGALAALARAGILAASIAFSGDTLRGMQTMTAPQNAWLYRLPLYVIHGNIADDARAAGFCRPLIAPSSPAEMARFIREDLRVL